MTQLQEQYIDFLRSRFLDHFTCLHSYLQQAIKQKDKETFIDVLDDFNYRFICDQRNLAANKDAVEPILSVLKDIMISRKHPWYTNLLFKGQ